MASGAGILAGLGQGVDAFTKNYYKMQALKRGERIEDEDIEGKKAYNLGLSGGGNTRSMVSDVSTRGPAASPGAAPGSVSPAVLSQQTPGTPQQVNPMQEAERAAASYRDPAYREGMLRRGRADAANRQLKPQLDQGLKEFKDIELKKSKLPEEFAKLKNEILLLKQGFDDNEDNELLDDVEKDKDGETERGKAFRLHMRKTEAKMSELTRQQSLYDAEYGVKIKGLLELAVKADPRIGMLLQKLFEQSTMERPGTRQQMDQIMKPLNARSLTTR